MGSMYMSEDLLTANLLSTGYRKYWKVNQVDEGSNKTSNRYLARSRSVGRLSRARDRQGSASPDNQVTSCQPSPNSRLLRRTDFQDSPLINVNSSQERRHLHYQNHHHHSEEEFAELDEMVSNKGFSRLDMTTLNNIGWSSGAMDDIKVVNGDGQYGKEDLQKLTKVEFRRLKEQVRDVSMNLRNKFRTSAYQHPHFDHSLDQKLYQRPNGENVNQVYRTQLAASLKAFQPKQWAPLNHQEIDPNFLRCKPVIPSNDRPTSSYPSRSGTPTRLQRPKSVPASSLRTRSAFRRCETPSDVRPGRFDTLSPMVISDLMGKYERPSSGDQKSSPLLCAIQAETKLLTDRDDDADTTSGIDSADSDDDSPDSDEDSEFEPDVRSDVQLPDLNLRPEKLDAIYIPEPRRGWKQFDFDMENIDLPPYEFQSPFPEYLEDLDLKQMAKLKWNWRNHVKVKPGPKEAILECLLDRLVELEKLQMDTVDWENKRAIQLKKTPMKRNSSAKLKDKRCCSTCLQQTCCGDCPDKLVQSNTCEHCRQTFCTGTCKEVKYEQRMRQPRVEDERPPPPRSPHPKACTSCQKRHNAKYINANNLILGQSRLNNSTFTRGQGSVKTQDLRPKSETFLPKEVINEFEKLGLDTVQPSRPATAMTTRPRSRNALLPGKSFNSQRRESITDVGKSIGSTKKKKTRSSKIKRPKTAA